jgi:enoyl-CoA hydratase
MGEFVSGADVGAVRVITIDRPRALNALNVQVLQELAHELATLGTARAVVLTGAGAKAFVAGADIAAMRELSAVQAVQFAAFGQSVLDRIEALPVPVIAAVNGFALGGGCELAMACDIILCSNNAVFGQPEVKLGVIPGFGGTQRLVRRVGSQRARELCFTGRNVLAPEAVQIGLALRICENVVDEAVALAESIAANGPVAVRLAKRAILDADGLALGAAQVGERQLFGLCFTTTDQKEGMAAFVEKRKAEFTGN